MKTKFLYIITIFLSIAIACASGFLIYQKTGFNPLSYASNASAGVVKAVSGVFRAENSTKSTVKKQEKNNSQIKSNAPAPALAYNSLETKKENQNLTDSLTQTMAEQMIKNGLDPDLLDQNSEELSKAIEQSLGNTENLFALPKILDKDIRILDDNSEKAIQKYAQQLQDALNTIFSSATFQESDIMVATNAIENGQYKELDEYILAYESAYEQFLKIPAPSSWKNIHKEQIAIFYVSKEIMQALRNNNDDPMKSMIALARYPEIEEQAYNLAQKMVNMKK